MWPFLQLTVHYISHSIFESLGLLLQVRDLNPVAHFLFYLIKPFLSKI